MKKRQSNDNTREKETIQRQLRQDYPGVSSIEMTTLENRLVSKIIHQLQQTDNPTSSNFLWDDYSQRFDIFTEKEQAIANVFIFIDSSVSVSDHFLFRKKIKDELSNSQFNQETYKQLLEKESTIPEFACQLLRKKEKMHFFFSTLISMGVLTTGRINALYDYPHTGHFFPYNSEPGNDRQWLKTLYIIDGPNYSVRKDKIKLEFRV